MEPFEIVKKACKAISDKLGEDIAVLKVGSQTTLSDYFVIASATSTTHLNAIADEVEFQLSKAGVEPARVEGVSGSAWILIDYNSVIVHLFLKEARGFYSLEKLWADAEKIDIEDIKKDIE
ncbi:MAG: ribosome silencing factor [Oscillospiraceae bacterium]|jgi:ribosome-associated protein